MLIGIDMGHTLSGPNYGAVGIVKESEETRFIGKKLIDILKKEGHTVVDCSVDAASSNSDSLSKRVEKANKKYNGQNLDLFVSIHFNASNTQGHGTEVYTYNARQFPQAKNVLDKLVRLGLSNRGIKNGSHLYVIKNTKAQAMLVEICFCDNVTDVNIYNKNKNIIPLKIAEGILGKSINDTISNNNTGDDDMIPDTTKVAACDQSSIKNEMIEEIKILQGLFKMPIDGIATEALIKKLPELKGHEKKGVVTIMQRILILKGMLSKGSDTGVIGPANRNAVARFKETVGIPKSDILIDTLTWRKLLEY